MAKSFSNKSQKSRRTDPVSSSEKAEMPEQTAQYLKGIKAIIVEQGLGKARASILAKQLARHGGEEATKLSQAVTHVLVGNSVKLAKLAAILKVKEINEEINVLRADWLSTCLKEGKKVDFGAFSLRESNTTVATDQVKTSLANTQNIPCKTQGKRSINEALLCANVKDSCSKSSDRMAGSPIPTTSKESPDKKRQKIAANDSGSDYIDSETEEGGSDSDDDIDGMKPTEVSPHISPYKKVARKWHHCRDCGAYCLFANDVI